MAFIALALHLDRVKKSSSVRQSDSPLALVRDQRDQGTEWELQFYWSFVFHLILENKPINNLVCGFCNFTDS